MTTHNTPASLIGFDDIRFTILITGREDVYPGWRFAPTIVTRHIPGSNRAIVQHMGTPPASLSLRLEMADVDAYRALLARIGTVGSLVLLADFTSARGAVWHEHDRDYERLDDVLLAGLADEAFRVGGEVEVTATFQRAMNPLTGKAVT